MTDDEIDALLAELDALAHQAGGQPHQAYARAARAIRFLRLKLDDERDEVRYEADKRGLF